MFEGGRNGVLLLSQHVFGETESLTLPSFLIQRVALHAQANFPGIGPTDVFKALFGSSAS